MKILIAIYLLLLTPLSSVLALTTPLDRFKSLADQSGFDTTATGTKITVVLGIIAYVLTFVGIFFLIMIIYSGFQWITAGGNEDTIEKAQTRLKNSVIGFFIIAIAYSLILFVLNFWQVGLDNRYL
ncbi:MAG: hypothetical protein Q8P32_00650 [Candidatus Komeilibacteria bacterium]|nr:hypothetical protein [Candidatus Komeilibacteria bacterium]